MGLAHCIITFLWVISARWFIPVNIVLASTLGCIVGYAVAYMVKPPPEFFNFTVVMIGIGTSSFRFQLYSWISLLVESVQFSFMCL